MFPRLIEIEIEIEMILNAEHIGLDCSACDVGYPRTYREQLWGSDGKCCIGCVTLSGKLLHSPVLTEAGSVQCNAPGDSSR
jgi:hypothetical protein